MTQQDDQQQPKVQRVVVWEGEWPVYRRFAKNLLNFRDCVINSTQETRSFATKTTQDTTQLAKTTYHDTVKTVNTVYKDYPLVVPTLFSLAFMIGGRRYTSSAASTLKHGVLGFGAGTVFYLGTAGAPAIENMRHSASSMISMSTSAIANMATPPAPATSSSSPTTNQQEDASVVVVIEPTEEKQQ